MNWKKFFPKLVKGKTNVRIKVKIDKKIKNLVGFFAVKKNRLVLIEKIREISVKTLIVNQSV